MKIFRTLLLAACSWLALGASAQIVESRPAMLQQNSKDVVIVFHADRGNGALKGVTSGVYAHTGVITTDSKSPSDWKHAPTWGKNDDKYALTFVGNDTWELNVGSIAEYYGLADDEVVTKLAFVFRDATSTKQGKTENGGDIFLDVNDGSFDFVLSHDASSTLLEQGTKVNFTATANEVADFTATCNGNQIFTGKGEAVKFSVDMTEKGDYAITVVAKNAKGETAEKSMTFLYLEAPHAATYPGGVPRMGAVTNADGTVTFCLAAPQKESVIIVGSWDEYQLTSKGVMNYQDYEGNRYFWTTISGLEKGKYYPYYYLVDKKTKVADPYAHLVLDCYNDKYLKLAEDMPKYPYDIMDDTMLAVYRSDMDEYDWQVKDFTIPDHDKLYVYELLLRDFTGTDSRDDGTLAQARTRLQYLYHLGVNAIELMPIMEFNGNNSWGYNTNFYMAPDKAYGTPKEYKEFIDLCHSFGMAVILDIVLNQSDGLHPWYQMYPVGSNPFYNAEAPHAYSVLNDWKQENPLVQQQWKDAIEYWMTEYNVDGFRFDLVKGLGDSDSYGNNSGSNTEKYNASRVTNMARLNSYIKGVKPDGIHINEHLAGAQEENEMAKTGQINWMNINNSASQVAMGYSSDSNLNPFYSVSAGRTRGSSISYAESHDEHRMGYKQTQWGVTSEIKTDLRVRMERLASVAAMLVMTPGPHMIWQFQELGADENTKSASGSNNTSPKKVLWGYLEDEERKALHSTYVKLGNIRNSNPEMFGNESIVRTGMNGFSTGYYLDVEKGDKEILLLCNPNTAGSLEVKYGTQKINENNCEVYISTYRYTPEVKFEGNTVKAEIPAGCFVIVGTKSVSGINEVVADDNNKCEIIGGNGEISINGEYTNVAVYDLSGRQKGLTGLAAGIYIVNVDGQTAKVVVR